MKDKQAKDSRARFEDIKRAAEEIGLPECTKLPSPVQPAQITAGFGSQVHPADAPKPPLVSDVETLRIWREGVWQFVRIVAEHQFHRLPALAQEQKQQGFNSAADKYVRAMWQWTMTQIPDDLLTKINNLKSPTLAQPFDANSLKHDTTRSVLDYLLRRTSFLEGLKHGQAHRPEWYRGFASQFEVADMLNDLDVFRAFASAKQKRESKKPRPGWGQLRFRILRTWLAGGLWRLPNEGERCKTLNELWQAGNSEHAGEENFKRTRQKLGL